MKLSAAQINGFMAKPDPAARVILVYGPDSGLVHERAATLSKQVVADLNDPFRTANLTAAALTDDPARLHDEMAAQALGGGRRLIRMTTAAESMAPALDGLLKNMPPTDSVLVIEAGDLDKRSKLRSLCENSDGAVAIPCYVEEGAARTRIISDILQSEGLRITREALALLTDALPPDRMAMRSELEKLALYCRANPSGAVAVARSAEQSRQTQDAVAVARSAEQSRPIISIEDVQATIQDAGAAELDDLIFAVGMGEAKRAVVLIDRLLEEQTSPVAILRAAQRHFLRLQWARHQMDTGASATEAVKRLQPPVFWKFQDSFAAQLRRWSRIRIESALTRLFEAEAAVKRTGTPDQTLCAQLLLGLAA